MYTERVFKASNGYLYLTGGFNSVTSLYTEAGFNAAVDCDAWAKRLVQRAKNLTAGGGRFVQLIVPEKLTVYPLCEADRRQVFPEYGADEIISPGTRFLAKIQDDHICYPDEFLLRQTKTLKIYPATDSHWTWQGAFSAFQLLMWQLNLAPDYDKLIQLPIRKMYYRGDLWEPEYHDIGPEEMQRLQIPAGIQRSYVNALMGLKERLKIEDEVGLHRGSHCIFNNRAAQFDETVVIFGSSFSEARLEPSLLTAIFAYYFRTVHFIWSPSWDYDYAARHPAALYIAETPERFLTEQPADDFNVEEFGLARVRKWLASRD